MKKQILLLAIFTLTLVFALTLNSSGQVVYTSNLTGAPTKTAAVPLTCAMAADALHPIPGATYNYSVTASPAAAAGGYIQWFVTDQTTIIDGTGTAPVLQPVHDAGDGDGRYILLADPLRYDLTTNVANSISISWKYFDGNAQTVLLVAYIMDNNGCTNNVEVYRIIPTFGFTLDIAALLDAGTPGNSECVSMVQSAVYNSTARTLAMNYGENWVFFSVTAANFVHSWMPNIQSLNYTGPGTVDITSLQWAYPAEAIANTAWHDTDEPVIARDASGAVGPLGEDIVVRARIVHTTDPRIAAGVLTLGIDGTMYNPAGTGNYTTAALLDMDNPTSGTTCVQNITDRADYTLTPRPSLTTTTVGVAPNPNPGPFETKN